MNERTGRGWAWLLAAAGVTIVIWQLPGGRLVLYPFTILATWFHEMGHGLAAMFTGGSFDRLVLMPDGSGAAHWHVDPGTFGQDGFWARMRYATVAGMGPMGPALAGGALILASRGKSAGRTPLLALSAALLLSMLLWIDGGFGLAVCGFLALLIGLVALACRDTVRQFFVQFLGVQACISCYQQVGYLFTRYAGPAGVSDTETMAQVLFMPFWFWGALLTVATLAVLGLSLWWAYEPD